MSEYVIVTDSSSDLPAQMVAELGLEVLPLSFHTQGKTYRNYPDEREMGYKELYALLRAGEVVTTSAVSVGDFVERLDPILASGKDVLILPMSSALSATYQSSVIAADELREKYPARKVFTVDTLSASMGQGLLVCLAAREKAKGKTIDQLRDWAEETRLHIIHWVCIDDLHFLRRGGRISATSAVLGTMLSIKPLITVTDEGKLVNAAKARGRAAAHTAALDRMAESATDPVNDPVFISHSDCLEDAEKMAAEIRRRFGTKEIVIGPIGPVIGAHTGPGTVTIFFLGSKR